MNRIYIGSVMFDISEKDIEAVFQTFGPVKNCNMITEGALKRHKGYGFIEFETPDAAQLAIDQMNGAELGGRPIKAGRPTNYPVDWPPGVPMANPYRIYVANIHEMVQESELQRVFEVFGPVKQCSLIPDSLQPSRHRGYGYVEFEAVAEEVITAAVQSLNGFELAGRVLRVGRTVVGGVMPKGMGEQQAKRRQEEASRVPQAVLRAAEQINASLIPSSSASPSAVMVLFNVEDYEALVQNPSLPAELEEEISEECSKFGTVDRVLVHLDHRLRTARVFVRFTGGQEQAMAAIKVMHHRWFAGRQIMAELFDEQVFASLLNSNKAPQ